MMSSLNQTLASLVELCCSFKTSLGQGINPERTTVCEKVRRMSSPNQDWNWLISICVKEKFRFCPGANGAEPWISMEAVAFLVQQEAAWVARKFKGLRRHPCFPLVKITDLEALSGEET